MQPGRQCRQTQALRRAGQEIVVTSPAPGQVPDTGQEGKHEVELLFNLKADWCSACCAIWCYGGGKCRPTTRLDELANCPEKAAKYDSEATAQRCSTTLSIAHSAGPSQAPTALCTGASVGDPRGAHHVPDRCPF